MSHPYRILDPAQCNGSIADASYAHRCAFTVMAKAPIPGKVKTRLSPPLTSREAADLNACFLRDTVASLLQASDSVPAEVVISYTPVGAESAFLGILPEDTLLLPQRGDSFGERLLFTAADLFACGFGAVCLIDSDSPTVPTVEFITAATELLNPGARAVLGPSADGGYYLIGLQSAEANLFDRITWSTSSVADETLDRAKEIGLPMTLLAQWYDVDDAHSFDRLCEELRQAAGRGYSAAHTREYLATLAASEARVEKIA